MVASNTYGRQVVIPLTNKSGGGVIAGDVVVVGTANDSAFTTSTAGGFTGTVGIAQETIADSATGRVLTAGYAALVNVNASVTRQNFGKTHTVAKQAVDAGATRGVGTFCQFLKAGTTPDAVVYSPDLGAGSGAPTTSQYLTGALDAGLSAEKAMPHLYANYDPDNYPLTFNAASSEFDGTGATYTWVSAPSASDVNTTLKGHFYVETAASAQYYYRTAYAPGAVAFTIAAKVMMAWPEGAASTTQLGIALLDSSDTLIWRALILDDGVAGNPLNMRYFDTVGSAYSIAAGGSMPVYLLIQRTAGGAYTGFWSFNGKVWVQGGTSTPAGTVGKVAVSVLGGSTTRSYFAIDFIRVFDTPVTRIIGA